MVVIVWNQSAEVSGLVGGIGVCVGIVKERQWLGHVGRDSHHPSSHLLK